MAEHTCTTGTTIDGRPPPPCAECFAAIYQGGKVVGATANFAPMPVQLAAPDLTLASTPAAPYGTIDGLVREKNRLSKRVLLLELVLSDLATSLEGIVADETADGRRNSNVAQTCRPNAKRIRELLATSQTGGAAADEGRNT